jgi:hypothetical protein
MAQTTPTQDTNKEAKEAKTNTAPAEMKTSTFKGALVDMACASRTSSTTPTASSDQPNSANRSSNDSGATCPVTTNSREFGLKMDDGKTVRFDLVGNQRAQDAMKNEKSWSKDLEANKPIRVKVSGVLNGDRLIVTSVH